MATSTDISRIKTLISSGMLDEAVKALLQFAKNERNSLLERFGIHLSGQVSDLSKKIINGTLSNDEINRTKNKIQETLLDVLRRYENKTLDELDPQGMPLPPISPWVKWQKRVAAIFILGIASFMLYEAYVAFLPKDEGEIDESKCWVKTKPYFAELLNEPRFGPNVAAVASLPGNTRFQVEEVTLEDFGMMKNKYYKIRKGATIGWIPQRNVQIASPNCDSK